MQASSVTLIEMLNARSDRAEHQQLLQTRYPGPLVCLTMNIPGDVKNSPLIRLLFYEGVRRFRDAVIEAQGLPTAMSGGAEANAASPVRFEEIWDRKTGCEAFFCFDGDASPEELKQITTRMEDAFPAARLYDFDVLAPDGEKLSRPVRRTCLLCDRPAVECASRRAHGLEALKAGTEKLLEDYAAGLFAEEAVAALKQEVSLTPKPGLVDCENSGAHRDMDRETFLRSAEALRPYWRETVYCGLKGTGMAPLKQAGLLAEADMYRATEGVNTHRGMIYSLGLILYGLGRALKTGEDPLKAAADLAAGDGLQRLRRSVCADPAGREYGPEIYQKYGAGGAVFEAMEGFPRARAAADRLRQLRGQTQEDAELLTMLDLMATAEDCNLLHRGGREGLTFVQREAKSILDKKLRGTALRTALCGFDRELIQRNLSPGGSADLLALALFLNASPVSIAANLSAGPDVDR